MFASLPEPIQKEVLFYLASNDFIKAKRVRDDWLAHNHAKDNDNDTN